MCACGLTLQANDTNYARYAFIDSCSASDYLNENFKLFDKTLMNTLKDGVLDTLNCTNTITNDYDKVEWNKIKYVKFFKCARIVSSNCQSFLVFKTYF